MEKVRVYEIAEEAGVSSSDVIEKAKILGIELKSPQSAASYEEAEEITKYILTGEISYSTKNAKKVILNWFKNNYDEPKNILPYDSSKGEYIAIFGDLVEPYTLISNKYKHHVNDDLIKDISNDLIKYSNKWSPRPKENNYNKYKEINNIEKISNIIHIFNNSINNLKLLLKIKIPNPEIQKYQNYLLFSNVYTIIETLLSDVFCFKIFNNKDIQRKFLENYDEFNTKKLTFAELFDKYENIENEINATLDKFLWHKFETVMKLYEKVLEVKINLGYFIKYRDLRHDIIHRNGRKQKVNNLDYNIIEISDIEKLIDNAEQIKETIIKEFDIEINYSFLGKIIFDSINESFLNINMQDELVISNERIFFDQIIDKKESFRKNPIYPERKSKKAKNKRF
jgi:hypothetical protein